MAVTIFVLRKSTTLPFACCYGRGGSKKGKQNLRYPFNEFLLCHPDVKAIINWLAPILHLHIMPHAAPDGACWSMPKVGSRDTNFHP